jgi:hypothetical protein
MTLGDVLFDTGEADLKNSANRTVLKIVQFLQLNPKRVVRIEGYTDSTGGEQENLKLSRDRAQSVADVLVDLGSTKNASRSKATATNTRWTPTLPSAVARRTVGWKLCSPTKRPAGRRPLNQVCPINPGLSRFLLPEFCLSPLQFLLTLPYVLDYCGNCPRTLLNCAGMFHTKIKYP